MPPFHPAIAALAEQRQADLRHQAEQARLARALRLARRARRRRTARRRWLLAQRPVTAWAHEGRGGTTMRVEVFIDPASGWTWWTSRSLVEGGTRADEDRTGASHHLAGQGLVLRLLGRVGAWFGICEQAPSGAWRRVHVPRRDPWEPGARHSTVWSWWCP